MDVHGGALAILFAGARAGGNHLAFLGFLFGGFRQEDAHHAMVRLLHNFYDQMVAEWFEIHCAILRFGLLLKSPTSIKKAWIEVGDSKVMDDWH
jgi:hypothetical protein